MFLQIQFFCVTWQFDVKSAWIQTPFSTRLRTLCFTDPILAQCSQTESRRVLAGSPGLWFPVDLVPLFLFSLYYSCFSPYLQEAVLMWTLTARINHRNESYWKIVFKLLKYWATLRLSENKPEIVGLMPGQSLVQDLMEDLQTVLWLGTSFSRAPDVRVFIMCRVIPRCPDQMFYTSWPHNVWLHKSR